MCVCVKFPHLDLNFLQANLLDKYQKSGMEHLPSKQKNQ